MLLFGLARSSQTQLSSNQPSQVHHIPPATLFIVGEAPTRARPMSTHLHTQPAAPSGGSLGMSWASRWWGDPFPAGSRTITSASCARARVLIHRPAAALARFSVVRT